MKGDEHIKINRTIVEIFKTNVNDQPLANKIVSELKQFYPDCQINFDLEDSDKVLRIEGYSSIDILGILNYGKISNIQIEVIDY